MRGKLNGPGARLAYVDFLEEAAFCLRQRNVDVLRLTVVRKHHLVRFAPDAGFLVTAEGGVSRQFVVGIDPHASRADCFSDAKSAVDVSSPNSSAQTVLTVVGHRDDLFFSLEFDHHGDRAEDFFLSHAHIVGDINEQCRLDESAARAAFDFCGLTTGLYPSAL